MGFKKLDVVIVTNVDLTNLLWKEGQVLHVQGRDVSVNIDNITYVMHASSLILKSEFKDNPMNEKHGKKESEGKLNYELDFSFIEQMGLRMAKNTKYPPYNWQLPMEVEGLKQALFRHVMEVMKGNYDDEGEALAHFHAISTNAMMIHYQLKHYSKDETKGNN